MAVIRENIGAVGITHDAGQVLHARAQVIPFSGLDTKGGFDVHVHFYCS
jgi:hypothetical protein